VRRVNPAANATTRQVEVLVDFTGSKQPKLAGLYAEGRVETESSSAITVPATAVVRDGDRVSAWRVQESKLQKAPITVGDRDPRTGEYPVKSGLADGDKVIRYPTALLKDGQTIQASATSGAATEADAKSGAAASAEPGRS
jgi:membrane fusion protein (multidrug efflux system)